MGYIIVNNKGDITSLSEDHIADAIEINDPVLFAAMDAHPTDYKFINESILHTPRPTPYQTWTGTEWMHDALLVAQAKENQWEKIKDYRQQRQYMGVYVNIGGTSHWIHSDETSRSLHLGMLGAAILHILHTVVGITTLPLCPANQMWKTMAVNAQGQPVFALLDYVAAMQIFAADAALTSQCFAKAEYHRFFLEASTDPLNYNYTTGWPLVYGEA